MNGTELEGKLGRIYVFKPLEALDNLEDLVTCQECFSEAYANRVVIENYLLAFKSVIRLLFEDGELPKDALLDAYKECYGEDADYDNLKDVLKDMNLISDNLQESLNKTLYKNSTFKKFDR